LKFLKGMEMGIKQKIKFFLWKIGIRKTIKPPHIKKEKIIKFYQKKFGLGILIETGTYEGEMIDALKNKFKYIFSIELNPFLARKAKEKFSRFKKIKIIQGDSGKELPKILKKISVPSLFWLDAHYSGGKTSKGKKDTPILKELEEIIKHPNKNIILIDDADEFGKGDYPSFKKLYGLVKDNFNMEIKNNIIQIFPKKQKTMVNN